MKSRTMRVIVPTLATFLVFAAIATIFVVRSESASPKPRARATATPAASWTTFRDPLGLYTIQYPAGWTVSGIAAGSSDAYDFTETAAPTMTIRIGASALTTPDTRQQYCKPEPNANTTFDGVPAYATFDGMPWPAKNWNGLVFTTGNAYFQINEGPPRGEYIPATTPRPPTLQVQQAVYTSILDTFHSLAPKGSTCQ